MSWRALVALLSLAAHQGLGCGPAPRTAIATVESYFHTLARDPLRNLELLTPAFHRAHGLKPMTQAEAKRFELGLSPAPKSQEHSAADQSIGAVSPDAARLAWLVVQMKPSYRRLARELSIRPLRVKEEAYQALVSVSVRAPQGPRFVQQFALSRAADQAPWRIDHIDQRGVVAANLKAAVVAFPNIEHQRRLRPAASN